MFDSLEIKFKLCYGYGSGIRINDWDPDPTLTVVFLYTICYQKFVCKILGLVTIWIWYGAELF